MGKDFEVTETVYSTPPSRTASTDSSAFANAPKPVRNKRGHKLSEYFYGPRDATRHSKLPLFFRVHGSVLPHIVAPLIFVAAYTSILCYIYVETKWGQKLMKKKWETTQLTLMSFLMGAAINLRNSSALQRYEAARSAWASMHTTCVNLTRLCWIAMKIPDDERGPEVLLNKLTVINMIAAFPRAVMHRLRFEPYIEYDDMSGYVSYMETYAKSANMGVDPNHPKPGLIKHWCQHLGLPFAIDNPRVLFKRADKPVGNLPQELLIQIQSFFNAVIESKSIAVMGYQMQLLNQSQLFQTALNTCEKILNTPLPIAYSITITQVVWIYILILPFQIIDKFRWMALPAVMFSSYMILSNLAIGFELENPFGLGVNDLPLEQFCEQIQNDIDIITSKKPIYGFDFIKQIDNMPLYPAYLNGYAEWSSRSVDDIYEALSHRMDDKIFYSEKKGARRVDLTDPSSLA